jgi:hypothetical protein
MCVTSASHWLADHVDGLPLRLLQQAQGLLLTEAKDLADLNRPPMASIMEFRGPASQA